MCNLTIKKNMNLCTKCVLAVFLVKPWHNLLIRDIIWSSITLEQSVLSMTISQFVLLHPWIRCWPLFLLSKGNSILIDMLDIFLCCPSCICLQIPLLCSSFLFVQLLLLKSTDSADIEWSKEVKGSMYDVIVEGFQLLSRWTARIWEQCAWKFSRPCKDPVPLESHETSASFSDYEKVLCPLCIFLFFFRLIFNKSFLSPFHICLILSLTAVTNQYLSTCSDLFVYHLYLNCLLFLSSIWSLFYFFSPLCILCAHRAFFLLIKFHLTYKNKNKNCLLFFSSSSSSSFEVSLVSSVFVFILGHN